MDKLESIRKRQHDNIERQLARAQREADKPGRQEKPKKAKNRKKKSKAGRVVKTLIVLFVLGVMGAAATVVWATWGMDFDFADSFNKFGLSLSSVVYYEDAEGNLNQYERLVADENRVWVDYDAIPDNMKNAFVAIEDQRFYRHHGVDLKRTAGAVINVLRNGDSSYGGSTITQQLVKNITEDSEHSKARKIREMVRAVIIETKMDKREILELYMNSIYLGHGANGVQAASHAYFAKDVAELNLEECAAIAGITQHPSTYDPIVNPDGNKEKRRLVLDKMLELGYIGQTEYDEASNAQLNVVSADESSAAQSYFVDCLFEELLADLVEVKGYTQSYATALIYNGGLKIVATVDPDVQNIMDDVYANGKGFPKFYGEQPESAMIITDPYTGQIKGIVGGTGVKTGARVLNRATQTKRQPGSTIKPLAVYGPGIDLGVITAASTVENSPLTLNGWKPNNANRKFTGPVSVRKAVASSLNLPAVRVLEEVGLDKSFDYLTKNLHLSLIESKKTDTGISSDKGYAPLALGGLTEGVTLSEINAAYTAFANSGVYVQPTSYTKVYDSSGNLLLSKTPERNKAFSEETAFIMNQLLKGVVQSGTAAGSAITGMDTCGKTGSADDNKDRWFVGYTPYYVGSVWVGYDEPKVISYAGVNPALTIWRSVMTRVHNGLEPRAFEQPQFVKKAYVCSNSGEYGTNSCSGSTDYVNTRLISGYCSGVHKNHIGTPGEKIPGETNAGTDKDDKKKNNTTSAESKTDKNDSSEKNEKSEKSEKNEKNEKNENTASATGNDKTHTAPNVTETSHTGE